MRIFDIIKSELMADKLKAEEELERVINDKGLETNDKVVSIKKILYDIAMTESSFEAFKKLIPDDRTNKKDKKD
tara:strand:- start:241 stop:462 length:222 start_codon:yes stop_codon:yes gene_type:complete